MARLIADLLVVARVAARFAVAGRLQRVGGLVGELLVALQALPEVGGRGEGVELGLKAGRVVELDDAVAVGRVGELEAEDLGVVLGLLEALARRLVLGLGLDHGDGDVGGVAEDVVGALAGATACLLAGDDDASVGEGALRVDPVGLVLPAGRLELRLDVQATGVGFVVAHAAPTCAAPSSARPLRSCGMVNRFYRGSRSDSSPAQHTEPVRPVTYATQVVPGSTGISLIWRTIQREWPGMSAAASAPRRHHYVPASYLQGFTPSGTRSDYLWVHDYEDKNSFRSKPDGVGHARDLYRFRSNPATDMDMDIEEALAKIDADGARVIAEIEATFGGPDTENETGDLDPAGMVVLLHYACIMYLRNPALRRSLAALAGNQASLLMRFESLKYAGPEEFRAELTRMGIELPEGLGAAEVLSHLQSPGFRVEIDDPDWLLLESFSAEVEILKLLMERQWTLWVTDEERGYFVTSDRPMVLMWDSPHPAASCRDSPTATRTSSFP